MRVSAAQSTLVRHVVAGSWRPAITTRLRAGNCGSSVSRSQSSSDVQHLVGVDEQDAAGRPPLDHGGELAAIGAERTAQRDEESERRGFDIAAVDAHDNAAGLVRDPREFFEQRGLAHPAGSVDVQRHEGRLVGQERRSEDLDLTSHARRNGAAVRTRAGRRSGHIRRAAVSSSAPIGGAGTPARPAPVSPPAPREAWPHRRRSRRCDRWPAAATAATSR